MENEAQEETKGAASVLVAGNAAHPKPKRTRIRRLGNIVARIVLALLFAGGFFLSMLPQGRATARALLILPTVLLASEPAPLTLVNDPVRYTQMAIPSRDGTTYLDIYAPTTPAPLFPGTRGGMLIVPGVGDYRGNAVPQLVNLDLALAHTGLVVINVTAPTLRKYNLSTQDSDGIVQAFQLLAHWPGVGADRVGILGISGAGPATCLAATDPRIRDQIAFIALLGSYFDATTFLRAFGLRALTVDGRTQPWHPQPTPLMVMANFIATALPHYDGTLLVHAFTPGGPPLTASDLAHFSPAGLAAYRLLKGDEPGQTDANIAALPPEVRKQLAELSPSTFIDKIHAPIYLLHDRNDTSIPFTESREFAAALARIHHPYDLAEFGIFEHVEIRSGLGLGQLLGDAPNLFRILNEVLLPGS